MFEVFLFHRRAVAPPDHANHADAVLKRSEGRTQRPVPAAAREEAVKLLIHRRHSNGVARLDRRCRRIEMAPSFRDIDGREARRGQRDRERVSSAIRSSYSSSTYPASRACTTIPRCGYCITKPSPTRRCNASRTGLFADSEALRKAPLVEWRSRRNFER